MISDFSPEYLDILLKYELPSDFRILERDRWMATIDNCVHKYKGPCDGVFIDIGAHVGVVSARAVMAGFKSVYCYEPCEDNYRNLVYNLELIPDPKSHIYSHNVAVTDTTGDNFTLYNASSRQGINSGMRSGLYNPKCSIIDSRVKTVSFQDILSKFDRVEFLKVDTEGGEYKIFKPSSRLDFLLQRVENLNLEIHHPDNSTFFDPSVFIDNHPWHSSPESAPMELIDYVRSLGFLDMTYDDVMTTKTLEFSSKNHNLTPKLSE